MKTQKTILLELNEVNFEFIKFYAGKGCLPAFNQFLDRHGYAETTSENEHNLVEPWIQWVTVHTGKTYSDHNIFRLGDIVSDNKLKQIWEVLEEKNLSVAAVCPMNADNRVNKPAFFIPDPWTKTKASGNGLLLNFSRALSQAINDNAKSKITFKYSTFFCI